MARPRSLINPFAASAAALIAALMAGAAPAAEHFADKTIELTIGGDVGGGYDTYGRVLSRFWGKHIPGAPNIVAKNLPGAGSAKAAIYIYKVAPKNGTAVGALFPGAVMSPLTDDSLRGQYESTKFDYIGSIDSGTRVCATFHTSKTKTFADALTRETTMGASAAGGSTKDFSATLKSVAGAKFKIIAGYKGTADILLAMERGEVDGLCGYDWSSLKSARSDWIRDKKLNLLVQTAIDEEPELAKMGVPQIWGFLKNEDEKKIIEMLVSEQLFSRPYVLPPGTDPQAVQILRAAFDATMLDEAFLAEAAKSNLSVKPAGGTKVQELVKRLYLTPKSLLDRYEAAKGG